MASASKLEALLEVARAAKTFEAMAQAEHAFFVALLDATVYAHRPSGPMPPGRIRFIQIRRPDNGQLVLPFFTDQAQAEVPLSPERALIEATGRQLFEWTRGATLIMNPNREQAVLYPPEIDALLAGRPIGTLSRETIPRDTLTDGCPPSVPEDDLVEVLRACFAAEGTVRAGYLIEVRRSCGESEEVSLLLVVVSHGRHAERLAHVISLALATSKPTTALPLSVAFHDVDQDLPAICDRGIQFYGS
ncbi:SseB family protein [Metallibacterium scheffleri]|jgi:hypothetical protein|uniref:SseB protein N-terminal domain-containing protein n=1 Tax=Metallibacterium scheffleri TaxID=993689 RepID=A0A4S3KFG3_9GAMM|nr:SseB family protein [Metallibacterium scheffleri]THD07343.1 hypothetical protein B1806_15015 [Metallibacterium scheffleri]